MNHRLFMKWLKRQADADLNTLQELYAIVLEGNHGLDAVRAWIDGKPEYYDPVFDETVTFLMSSPARKDERIPER
jgi:hypothetical protein